MTQGTVTLGLAGAGQRLSIQPQHRAWAAPGPLQVLPARDLPQGQGLQFLPRYPLLITRAAVGFCVLFVLQFSKKLHMVSSGN